MFSWAAMIASSREVWPWSRTMVCAYARTFGEAARSAASLLSSSSARSPSPALCTNDASGPSAGFACALEPCAIAPADTATTQTPPRNTFLSSSLLMKSLLALESNAPVFFSSAKQLVRSDRQIAHALSGCVIDGVGDRRGDAGDAD